MSPDERRVYMREYMRIRRANLKNNSPINVETSEGIDGGIEDSEASDYATSTPWLVWGILGGIGLLFIGLVVFTVVSEKRKNKDSEASEGETNFINKDGYLTLTGQEHLAHNHMREIQDIVQSNHLPLSHTVPTPNLGQYES